MEAAVSMLAAATTYTIHTGEVDTDKPGYPYLVVWGSPAGRPSYTLNGYGGETVSTIQVTAVGLTFLDCLGAADRATKALHRQKATIAGRLVTPFENIELTPAPVPQIDKQVLEREGRRVYFVPMLFTIETSEILHP